MALGWLFRNNNYIKKKSQINMNIKKTNRLFCITEIKLRLKFGTEKNVTYIRIINNWMTTKQNQYNKTKKIKEK